MKRFRASIIGGAVYGSSEIIRRLLIHPDVELVKVSEIQNCSRAAPAAHPGRRPDRSRLREPRARGSGQGHGRRFPRLAAQSQRQRRPEDRRLGREDHRPLGRLPAQGRGRLRGVLRRRPPGAGAPRARRLWSARGEPRGDQEGHAHRISRLLCDDDRARALAAREGGLARRRGRHRRHHRPCSGEKARPRKPAPITRSAR